MKQSSESSRPKKHKVIAGLPALNEENYIGTIVLKTKKHVDEVIIVDDGSEDQTADIARLAGATVIRHEKRKGKGAAIQVLFAESRKREVDVLVILDADSQHNPDEIPSVIQPVLEGYDLSIGSRSAQANKTPQYRRMGQKVLLFFSHYISKANITDSESGFRAFSRKALSEIQLRENGFAVETEMLAEAAKNNLKIIEVPISNIYTRDGSTLNPIRHGLGVLNRILVMISERRPLFFFGFGGTVFTILGLIAGIKALYIVYTGGPAVNGWTLAALLLLIVGVLSAFTGIILNAFIKHRVN
ncbi:glycosyltransferase family 2 protein [Chloroflexota bacterium]